MKKIIITLSFLLSATSVFAQIRSYVGIVRQKYFPEHIKYLEEYRDELNGKGYSTYAEYIDSYLKGSFGSGFVYVEPDGTNYIITNRHVVSQAASASIEFEDSDSGALTKYDGLKVLLTSDDIDIAILGFSGGKRPFKKGLALSRSNVSDGQEVWSAGFPGLGGQPVWQLGKGNVTNAKARIKDLLDPSISSIIQHSAQVDGGNSGGPLMISSAKAVAGYEVVGINTWKASRRDSTNFSIPSAMIQKMLDELHKKSDSETENNDLLLRKEKFAAALKDSGADFTSILKYISYERAATQGQKDFDSVIHFAPSKVRSEVLDAFSYDPAEGLRYASAYQIWKKYNGKESEISAEWIKEHGLWRISEISGDVKKNDSEKSGKKDKKSSKSEKKDDAKSGFFGKPVIDGWDETVIYGGADLSLSGYKNGFFVGYDSFMLNDFWGFSMMYHRITADLPPSDDVGLNVFGMGMALRCPIRMNSIGISPFGRLSGDFSIHDWRLLFGYTAEIGLQAMIKPDADFHFGLGVSFKQMKISQTADFKVDTDEARTKHKTTPFADREKIDAFLNRSVSVYAIISF